LHDKIGGYSIIFRFYLSVGLNVKNEFYLYLHEVNMQQRLSNFFTIKKSQETIFNPFAQEGQRRQGDQRSKEDQRSQEDKGGHGLFIEKSVKSPVNIINILDSPIQTKETCVFVPPKEPPKLFPQDEPVEMIQPRTKDGKRLLYKHPRLPRVGPKGAYQLLVGGSDLSETAWLIQFDGAANPNPGPASSGAVLWSPKDLDGKRTPVFESGKYLGKATNNIAEVQGLLLGLQIAAMRGARELLIEGDSELIIFQQTGKYQVSNKNLKSWWANIQAAMMDETSFDWIAIRQVPREQNERADSITKEVLSKKQSFQRA
jgi:ribonuclease HI